jgi:hypothetical protein
VTIFLFSYLTPACPLLYLYNCPTDPNENTNNEEVFFWSVLRLLLGNNNSEVVFSFWSVPRLLPEEQEVFASFQQTGK